MIISHKHKFVFFKPLKVGGSSIEASIARHCGPDDILTGSDILEEREKFGYTERNVFDENGRTSFHMHTPPKLLEMITGSSWDDYFKFTVVRNPWEVVVSYFWWCFYSPANNISSGCHNIDSNVATKPNTLAPEKNDNLDILRLKFSNFVETVGHFNSGPRGDEGMHRILDWLSRTNEEFYSNVDFIVRYEDIQKDYDTICTMLNLSTEILPKLKSTQRKSKLHYSRYYDEMTNLQVKLAFKNSIERFDYKFAHA